MSYSMQFQPVLQRLPDFVEGAQRTLMLSGQSIVIGLAIGLAAALARTYGPRWLRLFVTGYVELFRNTPLLVQLLLTFFGLPLVGLRVSADQAALFAVSINLGAYATEIIRAGLQAIPRTQFEAGLALGMTRLQVIRHVVIVPALRITYPALTSQLTLTLLGTSIASAISASELMQVASIVESHTFRSLETYLLVAAIYICLTIAMKVIYWLIGLLLFSRRRPPLEARSSEQAI